MTGEPILRITHITFARHLSSGQRKQLSYEYSAAKKLDGVDWTVTALICSHSQYLSPFEVIVPAIFRGFLLRDAYAWFYVWQQSRQCDYVLFRHVPFDLFSFLFAPLIPNRLSVHHTKELEELLLVRKGWKGRLTAWIERYTACYTIARSRGVVGVTDEIARYEVDTRSLSKPTGVYPNGIEVELIEIAGDERELQRINAVFICSSFAAWHGLDRLMSAIEAYHFNPSEKDNIKIHLIGKLNATQVERLLSTPKLREVFVIHGVLTVEKYAPIVAACDIAIGSLALDRNHLTEAATLKVREMLAMGLPMYSTHFDAALPPSFVHFHTDSVVNISNLVSMAVAHKCVSRKQVRDAATPFISKVAMMSNLVSWLKGLR